MSEGERKKNVPQEPEPVEVLERKRRPLPLVIAWALAPAMFMILMSVCLAGRPAPEVLGVVFTGVMGGIATLLGWSTWMVYPANWTTRVKVLAVVSITVVMCAVNLFLAFGACAWMYPPPW